MVSKSYQYHEEEIKVPRFEEANGFYTTRQRSKTMSKIRAKNSKPELLLRKALHKSGVRYRVHVKNHIGKPDILIKKYRLAIFVDGDFWHGYKWEFKRDKIKTNSAFWIPKIERNIQHDRQVNYELQAYGFTVMRFWEHEVKQNLNKCLNQIMLYIETAKTMKIPLNP